MYVLMLKSSHHPDGKIADVLAPTHTCTTAYASVNYSGCVQQRSLKTSHRPNGKLMFCSLLAGRWCRSLGRHSVNRELPDQLQHSYQCGCSRSKFPIAPMGDSHFARCLQSGGVFVNGGSVTIDSCTISGNTATYVRTHLQKSPSPRWKTC